MSEQLKNRMQQFEVTPPPAAWEKIAERLDDDDRYLNVSGRLQRYEIAPPPQAWRHVSAGLDEAQANATISRKRFPVFFRVAAAATVAGILLGIWLFNRQPADVNAVPVAARKRVPPTAAPQHPAPPAAAAEIADAIVEVYNGNKPAKITAPALASLELKARDNDDRVLKYAVVSSLSAGQEYPIIIHSEPVKDANGAVIRNMDMLTSGGNYLIISGPNGQLTRISSKFASVIRYLDNDGGVEENLDKVIRESGTWKKRFSLWRKIISESGFIPSSANFLDIAEFKDLAADNQ